MPCILSKRVVVAFSSHFAMPEQHKAVQVHISFRHILHKAEDG